MAVVADEDTVLAVDIVPGQAGDAPLLVPMLDRTLERDRVHAIAQSGHPPAGADAGPDVGADLGR